MGGENEGYEQKTSEIVGWKEGVKKLVRRGDLRGETGLSRV